METLIFVLHSDNIKKNAYTALHPLPVDGSCEIIMRDVSKDKTRKQLGALFGLWVEYEAARSGESEDEIHHEWKRKFLARIYIIEPVNSEQEQWIELFAIYQGGNTQKFDKHVTRLSLSWANLKQTSTYMKKIEQHYQAIGMPLPIPDQYWRVHKTFKRGEV